MHTFTETYAIKYELSFARNYVWLIDNRCVNLKTGRTIKQVLVSRSIGYAISGKFRSLKYLKKYLVKPTKQETPF